MNRLKHSTCLNTNFIKWVSVLVFFLVTYVGSCQKTIPVIFEARVDGKKVMMNDTFYIGNQERIVLETFKFYISNVECFKDHQPVWKEAGSYHLVDVFDSSSFILHLPSSIKFNSIRFNLGIDSLTNVSGALGGDLDPTKGMYWAWQSGYINLKLEGKGSSSTHPKKEFQLHLGGYQFPFNTLKQIDLSLDQTKKILIAFDVKQFLEAANLAKLHHVMSPGPEAVMLSGTALPCFRIER